jgi:hypothetical protein
VMSAFSPGSLWVYVLLGLILLTLSTLASSSTSHPKTTNILTTTFQSASRPCLLRKTVLLCDGSDSSLCWLPSLLTYCAQTSTSSAGLTVTWEQLHSRVSLLSHINTLFFPRHDTPTIRCQQPATDNMFYRLTSSPTRLIESHIQTNNNSYILIRHFFSDRQSLLLTGLLLLLLLSGVFACWSYPDYCSGGSVPFCFPNLLFCLLACFARFARIDLFLFALIDFLQTQHSAVSLLDYSCLSLLSMAHQPPCRIFLHNSVIDSRRLMSLV